MTRIGIMQGRLVPPETEAIQAFPAESWRVEFPRAAEAGLDVIEWIYDVHGEGANPLETDEGVDEVRALADEHGIVVAAVCDDWLMPNRIGDVARAELEARVGHLIWLVGRAARLGADRVVVPFLDDSALDGERDEAEAAAALRRAIPHAERAGIELHLECSLEPERFARLLDELDSELVRVTYDSGNSAALGYVLAEEFAAYGSRIGSVHVKDRVRGGGTVPLGTGDADLQGLFDGLGRLGYDGDIVMQIARGETGDEVPWARANRETVESLLARVVRR